MKVTIRAEQVYLYSVRTKYQIEIIFNIIIMIQSIFVYNIRTRWLREFYYKSSGRRSNPLFALKLTFFYIFNKVKPNTASPSSIHYPTRIYPHPNAVAHFNWNSVSTQGSPHVQNPSQVESFGSIDIK